MPFILKIVILLYLFIYFRLCKYNRISVKTLWNAHALIAIIKIHYIRERVKKTAFILREEKALFDDFYCIMQIFIKLFLQAKMLVILINRKKLGKEMGKEVGREREIARSSKITMQLEQFSTINVTVSQVGTRIFDKRECYHFSYISSVHLNLSRYHII